VVGWMSGRECTHHLTYVVPITHIIRNAVHRMSIGGQRKRGKAPSAVGTNDIGKDPTQGLRTQKGQPGVIAVGHALLESTEVKLPLCLTI
jgi:hypothetical protein